MCRKSRWLVFFALLLKIGLVQAQEQNSWKMQVGDMRVLNLDRVARVAVGDGDVVSAITSDDKEVLVFARKKGHSSLTIWFKEAGHQKYQIHVSDHSEHHSLVELKRLLQRIPDIKISEVGEKIVVEGNQLSAQHKEKLEELKSKYKQIVDLSSPLAWEPMVLLDVQVIEIPSHYMRELGVRWADHSEGGVNTGVAWDGASSRLIDRPGAVVMPLPYASGAMAGYFGINALLSARLHALKQIGQAVVLAQPQLLARSGATAEFLAGGEVPYSTTDSNGNASTSFKPYGVSLKITPHIEKGGAVRSHVDVEVSSIDPSLSIPTGPSLKTRRASTEFNMHSGQTLVLAGFISQDTAENQHVIPGLHKIPLLGKLFSSTKTQKNKTELAIFVTPTLLDPEHDVVKERVRRSSAMIDEQFDVPILNVNSKPYRSEVAPARNWSHWQGKGSQWQLSEDVDVHTP